MPIALMLATLTDRRDFGEGWLLSVRQPTGEHEARTAGRFPMEAVQQRFDAQCVQHDSADEGLLLWALLDVVVDVVVKTDSAVVVVGQPS